jgi:NADH-quinone oxidoreductase subunit M
MTTFPLLSTLWLVPLAGAVVSIIVPPRWRRLAKWLGLAVAVAVLALAIVITAGFNTRGAP